MHPIELCKKNIMTSTCTTWARLRIFVLEKRFFFFWKKKKKVSECLSLNWASIRIQLLLEACLSPPHLSLSKGHQVGSDNNVMHHFVHNFIYKEKVVGGDG